MILYHEYSSLTAVTGTMFTLGVAITVGGVLSLSYFRKGSMKRRAVPVGDNQAILSQSTPSSDAQISSSDAETDEERGEPQLRVHSPASRMKDEEDEAKDLLISRLKSQ
jgi:hypothetical protein